MPTKSHQLLNLNFKFQIEIDPKNSMRRNAKRGDQNIDIVNEGEKNKNAPCLVTKERIQSDLVTL